MDDYESYDLYGGAVMRDSHGRFVSAGKKSRRKSSKKVSRKRTSRKRTSRKKVSRKRTRSRKGSSRKSTSKRLNNGIAALIAFDLLENGGVTAQTAQLAQATGADKKAVDAEAAKQKAKLDASAKAAEARAADRVAREAAAAKKLDEQKKAAAKKPDVKLAQAKMEKQQVNPDMFNTFMKLAQEQLEHLEYLWYDGWGTSYCDQRNNITTEDELMDLFKTMKAHVVKDPKLGGVMNISEKNFSKKSYEDKHKYLLDVCNGIKQAVKAKLNKDI